MSPVCAADNALATCQNTKAST